MPARRAVSIREADAYCVKPGLFTADPERPVHETGLRVPGPGGGVPYGELRITRAIRFPADVARAIVPSDYASSDVLDRVRDHGVEVLAVDPREFPRWRLVTDDGPGEPQVSRKQVRAAAKKLHRKGKPARVEFWSDAVADYVVAWQDGRRLDVEAQIRAALEWA